MSFVLALAFAPALAATDPCGNSDGNGRPRACVVRELTPAATPSLTIDARTNGGIAVTGREGGGIRVLAKISSSAPTAERARALAEAVKIDTTGGCIAAKGPNPASNESWSVSYEVVVPHTTDLVLQSYNGGLAVSGMDANVELSTTNGGIALENVNGDVSGTTTNGGVSVVLSGSGWRGAGLDVETTNGGVTVVVPGSYAAEIEASTVHGGVDIDGLAEHRDGNRIRATLGNGGAPIRLATTNGGISVNAR